MLSGCISIAATKNSDACASNACGNNSYMKLIKSEELDKRDDLFAVMASSDRSQIASMVLEPGQVSGAYGNEHADSDQVLYVIEGQAIAKIEGEEHELESGDTVLIEAGEKHQIRCQGHEALRTLNFYAPPGY